MKLLMRASQYMVPQKKTLTGLIDTMNSKSDPISL